MSPILNGVYDIEYWDDNGLHSFRARCISEQPLSDGLYLFEVDGEEIEVDIKDLVREISGELA